MEVMDLDAHLLDKLSINVIKKDGTREPYNVEKIKNAVHKAAERVNVEITEEEMHEVCVEVLMAILEKHKAEVTVNEMHNLVELALNNFDKNVAESYRNYRNYKQDFVHMLDKVYQESQRILYLGDKSNANADSTLVTTKRSLIFNELSTQLYKKFFLSVDELQAVKEGYIYCHDIGSRLLTTNCFRRDTKFITSQGVKSFNDFKDGDEVLVPTHKGRWKKAVVHSYGEQELNKVVFKRGSRWTREVYVTENHRWLLDNGTETTKLKVGDKLLPITNISDFDWDCISDEARKYWCYGFAMADGITRYQTCKTKEDSCYTQIILCGYKVEYATYFEEAGFTVTQPKHLADKGYLSVYIPNFDKKAITFDLIPFEHIKYFINGWLSADGNRSLAKNPTSTYRSLQVTGDSNSFVYDLLNVAGYYVTSIRDITGQETNYGMRFKETKSYNIFNNQGIYKWTVDSITPTDIKETVWCLEVEEDHSFILDGGIVCGNCCIADIAAILKGGFEMSNVWYNEPKTLEVAFGVIADIVLSASGAQYGGYTIGEVDKLLEPYAKLSYDKHYKEAVELGATDEKAKEHAWKKLVRETEQGVQQWEYKYNTLSSARGDFSFISVTFGLGKSEICKMISKAFMRIRAKGQGKKGFEKPVLFPKLIFLYDEQLHGEGCELEDVFNCAVECSKIAMYPDYYSLSGNNYAGNIYKKYGTPISMMGCRSALSPWFRRGGMHPADENDTPVYVGRGNMGVISLNLPMIFMKAKVENKDFYEVLHSYLELVRKLHLRTVGYLGNMKASCNPLMYTQGGFLGGTLNPDDKIAPVLKSFTTSFGITALNELQRLYNGKSIAEDGKFALEVMEYINKFVDKAKEEDHVLHAIYMTPAESLCGTQVQQFRKKYGIIKDVSDKDYFTNGFHCHVSEDLTPIEKQDLEGRFMDQAKGGQIYFNRFTCTYNTEAFKTLIRRAMKKGFYFGTNFAKSFCEDCGEESIDTNVCPNCGSENITQINRVCGYLGYSRINGDTRFNKAKLTEVKDRVSY